MTQPSIPLAPDATDQLAAFLCNLEFDHIPTDVVEHVKLCILDTLGCVVFGQTLPWSKVLRSFAQDETRSAGSTLWGTQLRTSPGMAALIHGTAGHGFEIDDLLMSGLFHPGSVTVPSAMAAAERSGGIDGKRFLAAVVAGYELGARVGASLGQPHFARGFHPQGTVGTLAAAASASVALGFDHYRTVDALGVAASLASGLMGAQTGGMTKRLHSGRASQNGFLAADLASRGFTGTPGLIEAEFGGYLSTLSGATLDGPALTDSLGSEWRTLESGFKAYAACAPIHTSVDAALNLRSKHGLEPSQIRSITVFTTTHTQLHCGWRYDPTDVTNAQMNLSYCVARAIIDGDLFVDQFDEEAIADPAAVALASRIQVQPKDEFDALGNSKRHTSEVEIHTSDGSVVSELVVQRTGSLEFPMGAEAIGSKFEKLTRKTFQPGHAEEIRRKVTRLQETANAVDLSDLLAVV